MTPNAEYRAMWLSPENTPNSHLKSIAKEINKAYELGANTALLNAQVFQCGECNDTFSKRNRHEFGGIEICNLCLPSESNKGIGGASFNGNVTRVDFDKDSNPIEPKNDTDTETRLVFNG